MSLLGWRRATGGAWRALPLAALLMLALATARADAQSLERIWSAANEAYFQGDHAAAIESYEALLAAGVADPDVYFNLATAYARAGQLGRAVLNYERTLWLAPGDDAAREDLEAAQEVLGNRRATRQGEATVRARPPLSEALVRPFSFDLLAWLVLVLELAFFALLLARKRFASEAGRISVAIALPLLAVGWLLAAAGLAVKSELFKSGYAAVVVREDAELREGPDGRAQVRAHALAGQSARVLAREGEFARVRLLDGAAGWMKHDDLGRIRPD